MFVQPDLCVHAHRRKKGQFKDGCVMCASRSIWKASLALVLSNVHNHILVHHYLLLQDVMALCVTLMVFCINWLWNGIWSPLNSQIQYSVSKVKTQTIIHFHAFVERMHWTYTDGVIILKQLVQHFDSWLLNGGRCLSADSLLCHLTKLVPSKRSWPGSHRILSTQKTIQLQTVLLLFVTSLFFSLSLIFYSQMTLTLCLQRTTLFAWRTRTDLFLKPTELSWFTKREK